ncbi:MAG: DUF3301 domain-containing protein [Alteromonadaceae bacterium]|nr:DUF3301 domain-containing protein [Alteromonadaceae bacterium]
MSLLDILLLLIIIVATIQFWRIRGITEYTNQYLKNYCEQQNLQLLSVARIKTRIGTERGKLDWHTFFSFEFSGNGADAYTGTVELKGMRVISTHMPPFKVN